jgi:hypothetical protein
MLRSARWQASFIVVTIGICGCHSTSGTAGRLGPTAEPVEIRMTPPRTLDLRLADGSSTSLEAVSHIRGQVLGTRGDSVVLGIESWRGGEPSVDHVGVSGQTVLHAADPALSIPQQHFSPQKTLLMISVMVGLVALAVGQAAVA